MIISASLKWALGTTILVYVVAMYAVALVAQRRIKDNEDFIVAGRRLPVSLAWMTLLATWFGAGTLLTAADEVHREGVRAAVLDPLGPGFCLLLAGLFVAGPMWRMGLLTLPDFFRRKFGVSAEIVSSLVMVPSYFGWIAAQFVVLAEMLNLFFGIDPQLGILLVAGVGTGYTLMGGMWSVTLTDAIQITLVLIGLVVLGGVALLELGGGQPVAGFTRFFAETPPQKLVVVPRENAVVLAEWLGLLAVGALGNLPGQDLMQRVFASRSEQVARRACYIAGSAYLAFGLIPVGLGLAVGLLAPETESSVLPTLAGLFLSPPVAVVFVLAILSAVFSTIDSAIIAPASVLAQNLASKVTRTPPLALNRWAVLFIAAASLGMAYAGDSAYSMLEGAYAITLVGLFVPLMLGLYTEPQSAKPALAAMFTGTGVWLCHYVMGYEHFLQFIPAIGNCPLPIALAATACSLLAYLCCEPPWRMQRVRGNRDQHLEEKTGPTSP